MFDLTRLVSFPCILDSKLGISEYLSFCGFLVTTNIKDFFRRQGTCVLELGLYRKS